MNILETYTTLTLDGIRRYVSERQEENVHLDFKTVKSASLRSEDDRRNLYKALSGFANSSGGIVVWGVDARKGEDAIDCAQTLVPIDPVAELVSRLNELTGQCVNPVVEGVQHRAVTGVRYGWVRSYSCAREPRRPAHGTRQEIL